MTFSLRNSLVLILLITIIITSCKKLDSIAQRDIYLAGELGVLKNETNLPLNYPTWINRISSVFVSGSDVYVIGEIGSTKLYRDGYNRVYNYWIAEIWKNGIGVDLTDENFNGFTTSLFVSGSDVYVTGGGVDKKTGASGSFLWKNGVGTKLCENFNVFSPKSIFVSGSDIYIAGYGVDTTSNSRPYIPKLWKNGTLTTITDDAYDGVLESVFVSGSDVYLAGHKNYLGSFAKVWKNGISMNLSDIKYDSLNINDSWANSVFVEGRDVYVAGNNHERAILWKNGLAQYLPDDYKISFAKSVFVLDSDIYVAGGEFQGVNHFAKLWVNGVAVNLPKPDSGGLFNVTSVFAK